MDALSDVLAMLKVKSTFSSRFEGRGAWAFRFPGYRHVKCGGVLAGRVHLWIDGSAQRETLEAGDFYLLTDGQPFCSASDPACALLDGVAMTRSHRGADGVARYGDGEPLVSLASGRFTFEGEANALLLRHLPPLIRLRGSDPAARPLAALLELLRWEANEARPGADVAYDSLATLILVQALRAYLATTPRPPGWLGALSDRRIGAALSALHGDLAHPWTVESLARAAGMSRTAFAVRFRQLVGTTPLDYLSGWRIAVAQRALASGDDGIARIAARVGYLSDTAFSAAFSRATGQSPGRYRRAVAAPPAAPSPAGGRGSSRQPCRRGAADVKC